MFGRKKELDLSLGDSNYSPAINPNTLPPQSATGAKPQPNPQPNPLQQQPKQQKQRQSNESKPPTIINNYYYVQPTPQMPQQPAPQGLSSSPIIDPRYSMNTDPRVRHQQQQQQQYQEQQQLQKQQQRHYPQQQKMQPHHSGQRKSSYNSDYDSFVNSAKTRGPHRSGSNSPLKATNPHSSIYESVSLFSSDSGRRSASDNLYLKSKMEAKVPEIEYEEEDSHTSQRSRQPTRKINLINVISKISDNDISVHNDELYDIFHKLSNGDDLMSFNSLADILCDPFEPAGRLPFSIRSVNVIINTFTSTRELNFRNFIKLAKFSKGCLVSFSFHDRNHRHMLSFGDFTKALASNSMVCPDELLAQLFEKSEDLDFEGYIVGIVGIRSWERRGSQ